ncbi:hypothetical protein GCK32_021698 [Trichostrongylus colubriformis]|uniref:Uncharacterized protein n=1 Tax=Trichostrongylus colubriformis TaxID=6319 RepID=A0AAN8FCZ9_TRICO
MRPQLHCTVENHSKPIPRSRSSGFHSKFVQREQVLQVALLVQIVSLFACSTVCGGFGLYSSQNSTPCSASFNVPHAVRYIT